MKDEYRLVERELFDKAAILITEMIEAVNTPSLDKILANLTAEAWNIS